ncbi:MAG: insulinase family protein [Bacteroidales bacterium]|nr:insulinase family protein [Candidatus Physcousia equi]
MKFRMILAAAALACTSLLSAQSQEEMAAMQQAMLQQLPMDPGTRYGKLDNGLTYYIRHNERPIGQANFYIAQKVGSVLEEDNQRGLAHFLEHMCFNGTKNFPGNQVIRYLESIGVKFGEQLNAYTSVDETVYNINNVPTTREATIDSVLLILHDWSHDLILDPKEIDKERGVIHEEWRMRSSAVMRIYERQLPRLLSNSRPGNRLPIGTMDVIDNFKPEALRAYYEKWYRPDQQAIIVVGDLDVDHVEAKIKEYFNSIQMPENAAERVYYDVPDNNEPIVACDKDKEQSVGIVMIFNKHKQLVPTEYKNTVNGIVTELAVGMACTMLNQRISELALNPEAPFIQAGVEDGDFILSKVTKALNTVVVPKEGKIDDAVKTVMAEVYRAAEHGFTATEYARCKAEVLSRMESAYQNRDKRENDSYIQECVQHFLENDPMPGIEMEYQLYNALAGQIPVEDINEALKQLVSVSDTNLVVLSMNPDKEGYVQPTEQQLLNDIHATQQMELAPYVDNVKEEPLIPELPTPGKIVTEKEAEFGAKEITLSNGVKVVYKKTDFKDNEVLMNAYSDGGTGRYPDRDAVTLELYSDFIGRSGLGNFTQVELEKALAGKQASVSPSITSRSEYLKGRAVPKDLRTMFELTYLRFQKPLRDDKAVGSMMMQVREALRNRDVNPQTALSDSIKTTLYGNHPRLVLLKEEELDKADYSRALDIYADRYADASDFTFVFCGNFDEDSLRTFSEQYLATLPALNRAEKAVDCKFGALTGVRENIFARKQEQPQCIMFVAQHFPMEHSVKNSIALSIMGQCLDMRMLEVVREEMSAAYSTSVGASLSMGSDGNYKANLQFMAPIKPEKLKAVRKAVDKEMKQAAKKGFDEKYISKVKEYMVKSYKEGERENGSWLSYIETLRREGIDGYHGFAEAVTGITNDDLKAVAKLFLNCGNKATVIMTPEK